MFKVDRLGLLACNGKPQPREGDRIDPLSDQSHRILVKASGFILMKNACSLHRQRTVHIDREIFVAFYQPVSFDLPQEIEHFLRSAHREGGDHHVSAPVKGGL